MDKTLFKVIEEHERFYVGLSQNGYRECFMKSEYKPDKDGYIHKKEKKQTGPGEFELDKEKINRMFNKGVFL